MADPSAPAKAPWSVHAGLLGVAVLWGASWPAGRVLALSMPPMTSAAWRFLLAVVVLALWLSLRGGWPRLSRRQWAGLVLGGAVGVAAWAMLFMLALQRVEASRAAIVVTTNPVFTTVLAAWIFKERFNAGVALGLALAVGGAVLVLSKGDLSGLIAGGFGAGEWLLLGCIASWTSYTLIGRALTGPPSALPRYGAGASERPGTPATGIDSLAATTLSMIVGTVILWAVALVVDGPASMAHTARTLTPGVWALLVLMSLGATVLSYAWFNRGIAVLGAGTAAGYINLVPVFGVALSALTLGEKVDAWLAIGGVLTVAGLVVSHRARRG